MRPALLLLAVACGSSFGGSDTAAPVKDTATSDRFDVVARRVNQSPPRVITVEELDEIDGAPCWERVPCREIGMHRRVRRGLCRQCSLDVCDSWAYKVELVACGR